MMVARPPEAASELTGRSDLKIECSGSVVRPIIPAFRAEDPGSNPGRSIRALFSIFAKDYPQKIFIDKFYL